jgi:predicted acylesterase/phospholipase RssA
LIAGTSTGAILATAIAIGRKPLPLSLIKSLTLTQLEQTLNAVSLTLIH